ncbi:tetratricopeptide repeat protein, partial [Geitlerinema sp. PCC 9228]|uniref:tetratricopeptide repeat protein n=1 Tax=Geitlerinema sp. PCC 9228 TaxID=111611 RepID=UPI00147BA097
MLSKLLHPLKTLWRAIKRLFSHPSPQQPPTEPDLQPLSDSNYEALFFELLDGVAEKGWGAAQLEAHLGNRLQDKHFRGWLRRFGKKVTNAPVPNLELGQRMVQLSQTGGGEIGKLAGDIGNQLLQRQQEPLQPEDYEPVFRQLLERLAQGESAVQQFLQELAPRASKDDMAAWLREWGNQQLAANEPNYSRIVPLLQLGQMSVGELASVAQEVGTQLQQRQEEEAIWEYAGPDLFSVAENRGNGEEGSDSDVEAEAKSWFDRGVQQFEAGDMEGALASCDRALQIQPDYYQAWTNRGAALYKLGRKEEALASYDRALQIQPDYYLAWNGR